MKLLCQFATLLVIPVFFSCNETTEQSLKGEQVGGSPESETRALPMEGYYWGVCLMEGDDIEVDHWLINRKADGSFTVKDYVFNSDRKVYFEIELHENKGTWSWSNCTYVRDYEVAEGVVRIEGDEAIDIVSEFVYVGSNYVSWTSKDSVSANESISYIFIERKIESYSPVIPDGYREVTIDEYYETK